MSLISDWKDLAYQDRDQDAYDAFWGDYLPKEQIIYEAILATPDQIIKGTVSELAKTYNMDHKTLVGFLDGINTSLKNELELESIKASTPIQLDVDLEKLYFNMLHAKADWLYNLPAWDSIFTLEKRKEIKKTYNQSKIIIKDKKIGRNDPCPCGSGKKYKQCCMNQ
ncbi:MAG: SEC-C domain-containing protein [Firmicutes bacterium HGW-Firmicutes-2]|jgi:preprotein translocase subunit SecA|nr:MAG: SEC-C domain-containing protein [Firmicutes bacterium HGW-Firmicutes-2]